MNKNIKKCCEAYFKSCQDIVDIFAKKQGLEFSYWIGGEVGGCADFNDVYSVSMEDIILDISKEVKAGKILNWIDDNVANEGYTINYSSYLNGLRCSVVKAQCNEDDVHPVIFCKNNSKAIKLVDELNLSICSKGDVLISKQGNELKYIRKLNDNEYYDHEVMYKNRSYGSRTNEGYVYKNNRDAVDNDIVLIVHKNN